MTSAEYLPFERGLKDGLLIYWRRLNTFLLVMGVSGVVLSAAHFLLNGNWIQVSIGIVTLLTLSTLTWFVNRLARTFRESAHLQVQNSELLEELRRQREAAEEASVAKSRFLAVASHDLRQPLRALGLVIQALQESSIAAQERHIVGNIRRSVDAMEELFDALLDISRLDAGLVRPHIATIPLTPLMERVRAEYESAAREKGLKLRVVRNSLFVRSDAELIERIMQNLLANAVRYTDRGRVILGARRTADSVRIEVWDSGRGIPQDKHREIFQEFRQIDDPARDRRKGLGLGLAIVERLAKLLDYPLELRSQLGRGSVFAVTVPRGRRADFLSGEADGQIVVDRDEANSLILVVDDEPAMGDSILAILGPWHGEVVAAESCADMLRKLVSIQRIPDLIVAKYRLRQESGIDVIARLREEFNAQVPALLITRDTGVEQSREAAESGLLVLRKPLVASRLRALISTLSWERTRAA